MKKIAFFLSVLLIIAFQYGCKKDYPATDIKVHYRIDSFKQDSVIFAGNIVIPTVVHVYYSVVNEGPVDINSYRYTINVKNVNDILYQIAESHYNPVPAMTERQDSTKIGVGAAWMNPSSVFMDNTAFQ